MRNTKHIKEFVKTNKNYCGVYEIKCSENGVIYIGSSVRIGNRVSGHFSALKSNRHPNKSFQADFNKYGADKFNCSILEICEESVLLEVERKYYKLAKITYNKNCFHKDIIIDPDLEERFNQLIRKDCPNGCWIWVGNVDKYGRLQVNKRRYNVHRISYYIKYKSLPTNKIVCHTCDNKLCVNPDHLFLGSHSDNHKDRRDKGIGNINLNWQQVNDLRQLCLEHNTKHAKELREMVYNKLGISIASNQVLYSILLNKTWYDPNWNSLRLPKLKGSECPWNKLNSSDVKLMRELYTIGKTIRQIYNQFSDKISITQIRRIVLNKRWYDPNYKVT